MSSILVVGNEGFIGKRLWSELIETDNLVRGVDAKRIKIEDISLEHSEFDVIVLLAANLDFDLKSYQDNLSIYNWAASNFPDAHFIFTSSAAVYGYGTWGKGELESWLGAGPINLYGQSKLLGEEIIKTTKQNYTILRLSNVYGDGDGNGAIDRFICGENKIYGDGQQRRDYIHVDKVVGAIKKIIENPAKYNQETYNISTNETESVLDVFREYGETNQIELEEAREFDVQFSQLNNKKAIEAGLLS